MNLNAFSKILTVVLTVVGALMAFDWSVFGLAPEQLGGFISLLGVVKLVAGAIQNGLPQLFSAEAPVKPAE